MAADAVSDVDRGVISGFRDGLRGLSDDAPAVAESLQWVPFGQMPFFAAFAACCKTIHFSNQGQIAAGA